MSAENICVSDTTVKPRKDMYLFEYEAVNEAVLNALVHNDWTVTEPQISLFTDRMEILSHGGLPSGMSTEDFYEGISHPRNSTLMRVFLNMGLTEHSIPSRFIMVECKNYSRDVANPEIDQIGGRFSPNRGQMGIIACRSVDDMQKLIDRCSDTYKDSRGLIIPLVDDDFCELLKYKAEKNEQAIDDFVQMRFHMVASR